ncbi:hypothetical protein [Aestuariivirga sp.]
MGGFAGLDLAYETGSGAGLTGKTGDTSDALTLTSTALLASLGRFEQAV